MTCSSCGREFNKDELIRENIDDHFFEIKKEVMKNFADELRKSIKKIIFRNQK
ncbi:hypothetical Protein YC6258_02838 [Gynuella sunshinyii YC6258]|uniref:C2H2-type domain-containing protein n=1 Tax=Gynuella sunshinyii YC6258 TaxID=1445510 RepID=A0A0C5VKQ2_9GAMM|nr:hypothetical Protein YC6258_02838 [Gynuella sunshinyii YC6258]